MTPLEIDDEWIWRTLDISASRLDRRVTDDGCEHYKHFSGRFFVLDYHFQDNEWKEVDSSKYTT